MERGNNWDFEMIFFFKISLKVTNSERDTGSFFTVIDRNEWAFPFIIGHKSHQILSKIMINYQKLW